MIGNAGALFVGRAKQRNPQRTGIFFEGVFLVAQAITVGAKCRVFIAAVQIGFEMIDQHALAIFHQVTFHNRAPVLGRGVLDRPGELRCVAAAVHQSFVITALLDGSIPCIETGFL